LSGWSLNVSKVAGARRVVKIAEGWSLNVGKVACARGVVKAAEERCT